MNDELRTLLGNMQATQALFDFKRERAETLRRCVDTSADDIIAADIEQMRAMDAAAKAHAAYFAAIKEVAEGRVA